MRSPSRMLVIVPTRGRPQNIARLSQAFKETTTAGARLLIGIDDDDPERDRYINLGIVWCVLATRLRLGPTLNYIAQRMTAQYDVIGFMGDDHLPRTRGWDQQILEAFDQHGSGFVYGNDKNQGERLPTACFISADVIRTLGYMVPAGLIHLYIDDAWRALGTGMGRFTYLPDTVIEHMHPTLNKAELDEGYTENNSPRMYSEDGGRFHDWVGRPSGLTADIARLRALL